MDNAKLNDALRAIGDYAHDHSTGPAVPDALWEVRCMAYDALSKSGGEQISGEAVERLLKRTFAIQYNPNCPSPWLVRLVGKSHSIDYKPYGDPLGRVRHQTGDILGFGKTMEEAAQAALQAALEPKP